MMASATNDTFSFVGALLGPRLLGGGGWVGKLKNEG